MGLSLLLLGLPWRIVLVGNFGGLKDDVAAVMAIPIVNRPPDLGLDAPEQARFTSHPIPRKKHS